ncbi:MAG: hypothetical protein Q9219_001597 [cf. Caloplaca sp. 3 TL-2023]
MGAVTDYSTRAIRTGPLWLLIKDTGVLITALPYLPLVFFPLNAKSDSQEDHSRLASFRDLAIQALLLLIQTILLILFFPALFSLPGITFILISLAGILINRLIAWPTQGPRTVESTMGKETFLSSQKYPNERWLFINGICTGRMGLQQNVDRLSYLFGRKVLGIHNESLGPISDIIECLLQRCLSYSTIDVRVAYEIIKEHLVDETVKKVVLVAHSQGGIIVSMVIDHLLAELNKDCMHKLRVQEIYTFGSAASHFHNPPANTNNTIIPPLTGKSSSLCIPYIEHYANEYDMVPRWGVLYAIKSLLTNRYAGKVFIRMGATGHMFVDHYLNPIFPVPTKPTSAKSRIVAVNGRQHGEVEVDGHRAEEAGGYLDAVVHLDDETTAQHQDFRARLRAKPQSKMVSGLQTPIVNGVNGRYGTLEGAASSDGNGNINILEQGRGKTVKDLSRLWKYLGGAEPED